MQQSQPFGIRSFELLDRDKSGNVELAELEEARAHTCRMCPPPHAKQVFKRFNINLPENQLRSLMSEFDTDGSGRIDFHEFIECVLQASASAITVAQEARNGFISPLRTSKTAHCDRSPRVLTPMTRKFVLEVYGYISRNSCSLGGVIETLNPGAQADESRFGHVSAHQH